MGLFVVVVLLLVVMPVLIYFVGWGVRRTFRKAPAWIGIPAPRPPLRRDPIGKREA